MRKEVTIFELEGRNYIVVDDEAFDWELEPEQLKIIELKIKNDPLMRESFIGNIFNHMASSFSEFLGKQVSLKEINDAIDNGYIE